MKIQCPILLQERNIFEPFVIMISSTLFKVQKKGSNLRGKMGGKIILIFVFLD